MFFRCRLARPALALAAHLFAAALFAQAPIPIQGTSRPSERRPQGESRVEPGLPVFEFRSGFWLNLHHFLYREARAARSRAEAAPEAADNSPAAEAGLTAEEQRAWQDALDYYAATLAGQDLLFNGDMVAIKNRLSEMEAEPDLQKSGLRPEMMAAMERAAPIYRAHWWPQHDRANRDWVAQVGPQVQRLGGELARRLAAVYQSAWPAERIRVDVSYVANWAGAYTTLDPLHVTISSSDPRNRGLAALEVLFHEASHALAGGVRDAIARECRARNRPIPRDLWHAVLFYTTGELVRRTLGGSAPGYTPYAYRQGLYQRGWESYLRVLERHWREYLDGRVEFDRAVARLVAAL
jgi:hypothetical protein